MITKRPSILRPLIETLATKSPLGLELNSAVNPSAKEISSRGPKTLSVPVADIAYSGSYRELDENHVADLQQSIERIGLTTPISLAAGSSKLVLIAGQHRLEAARRLGWTHIDAITFDANEAENRLIAISENLHRLELCPLDRAELQSEWLLAIRDQARQVADLAGGQQPNDRGISEASRQSGVSARQIARAEAIASISPEAKAKARELGLHEKQSALLKIAEGKTAGEQLKIASEIVERKPKPRSPKPASAGKVLNAEEFLRSGELVCAPSEGDVESLPPFLNRQNDPEKAFENLVAAWDDAPQLKLTWAESPPTAQLRFAVDVLRIAPAEKPGANHAN